MFKLGKISWALLITSAFAILGAYIAPFARELKNKHLGMACLERAKTFSVQGNWGKAGEEFRSALQYQPNNPEILRELVLLLDKTKNHGVAMRDALLRLRELKHETDADAILLAIIIFKDGQIKRAREAYNALSQAQRESPLAATLLQNIILNEGKNGAVETLLHSDVKEAISWCRNPFPEIKEKGTQTLWRLSESKDETSLQAINFLATLTTLTRAQMDLLIQRLDLHPKGSLPVLLSVYSSLMRNFPEDREGTLKKLASLHRDAPLNELRIFLQWLALEGESHILRSLVSEQTLQSDPGVFTAYLESFATTGQWSEILKLFDNLEPHFPIKPESVAFYRGKAWIHLETDGQKAKEQFNLAIQNCQVAKNSDMLQLIGKETAELNLAEVSEQAYRQLSELKPDLATYALQQSLAVATRKRDTNGIVRLVSQLSDLNTAHSEYTSQLCYLRLLQGAGMETLTFPENSLAEHDSLAFLKALRAYRFDDRRMIERHLSDVSPQVSLSDGQKAIYAGLLFGIGQDQKASQIADELILDLLLPEEKMFLKRALNMPKSNAK